jgi:transcriptional regulator with XRE-family HTH domain
MAKKSNGRTLRANGGEVTRLRIAEGLSQKALAKRCGISERTISRIENGEPTFVETLQAVAEALGVALRDITERDGPARSPQTLQVGLASENAGEIEEILNLFGSLRKDIKFEIHKERNEAAYQKFKNRQYDLIMLDDPWLPEYAPALTPLNQLGPFQDSKVLASTKQKFFRSLIGACEFPKGKLLGLPLVGNVQVLLYRNDSADAEAALKLLDGSAEGLERFSECVSGLASIGQPGRRPFVVRSRNPNHLVENFWEVLRGYGHEETQEGQEEVKVPRDKAEAALTRLDAVDPGWREAETGYRALQRLVEGDDVLMMFGWPGWIKPRLKSAPELSKVGAHPFAARPLLGAWVLAVPHDARHPESAAGVLEQLTTQTQLQTTLAKLGNIPVLKELWKGNVLDDRLFWTTANRRIIRKALGMALPRPRTPRWREIEAALNGDLHRGKLVDHPGLIRFY